MLVKQKFKTHSNKKALKTDFIRDILQKSGSVQQKTAQMESLVNSPHHNELKLFDIVMKS
jgi:hypothetical protein